MSTPIYDLVVYTLDFDPENEVQPQEFFTHESFMSRSGQDEWLMNTIEHINTL